MSHLLTSKRFGLRSDQVDVILDDRRTASELREHLATVVSQRRDAILLYYAGHGRRDLLNRDLYLALRDTRVDETSLRETSLLFSELWRHLSGVNTRLKIVVLDCCFAGTALSQLALKQIVAVDDLPGGVILVASTSALDPSNAPDRGTHTAFSGNLMNVLDAGLPTGLPHLGVNEVFREVARRCRRDNHPEPQILTAITEADVPFAYNAGYVGNVAVENALVDANDKIDHLVRRLRADKATSLRSSLAAEIRSMIRDLYPYLDKLAIDVENGADWSPEAIEECMGATHGIDDALDRHQIAARLAARRRRDVRPGGDISLRQLDEDTGVVLDGKRRILDRLMDLRSALRGLGRNSLLG